MMVEEGVEKDMKAGGRQSRRDAAGQSRQQQAPIARLGARAFMSVAMVGACLAMLLHAAIAALIQGGSRCFACRPWSMPMVRPWRCSARWRLRC